MTVARTVAMVSFGGNIKSRYCVALLVMTCFIVMIKVLRSRGSNGEGTVPSEAPVVRMIATDEPTTQYRINLSEHVPSNKPSIVKEVAWSRTTNSTNQNEPTRAAEEANEPWADHKLNTLNGILRYHDFSGSAYSVTYDERSFIINNKRTIILSGSVHYPRSTPGMWDHIFEEMVKDGLNAVEIYVFWNIHEFKRGQEYDFTGPANLPLFIEKAAKAGLFVNLRIGPYVCAEWNYGGLPVWLNFIPGMSLRSDSPAWEKEMERFVTGITKITEKYLARNGGPIILAQIENEFGWDKYIDYINWCGELVNKLDLGIPWVMCNGLSANNTINTCNANDCSQWYAKYHTEKFPGQPLAWMENEGWYQKWSVVDNTWSDRTPQDMAYVILAWLARGGSHHNYYMWYGGNHMGRWAASGITNKYADGANMHSDMLPNEPKRSHLTRLHKFIHNISNILLNSDIQVRNPWYLQYYNTTTKKPEWDPRQMAFVYDNDAGKITFLQNAAPMQMIVIFNNYNITMQPMSIIVLDKLNSVLYDSSKVDTTGLRTKREYSNDKTIISPFVVWSEGVTEITKGTTKIDEHPLEQLGVTLDETEYLFYQTRVDIPMYNKTSYELMVATRKANALVVFTNEKFEGAVDDHDTGADNIIMTLKIQPNGVAFNLTILSVSLGLYNVLSPGFVEQKGIVGKVSINEVDITHQKWLHRPKLTGEILQVYTDDGSKQVNWDSDYIKYINTSLTWFKTTFTVEQYSEDYSLLLHLVGFGRGHFYVNGVDLGRYWLITVDSQYVQEYYFIPPDVVRYDGPNLLVIGEELGAPDPSKASVVLSTMLV